jgi:hypothetical protein
MTVDIYRGRTNRSLRMVTIADAGLPDHVDPKDWARDDGNPLEMLALADDIAADIEARGFSFYKLCDFPGSGK